jgi:hypothetical protein
MRNGGIAARERSVVMTTHPSIAAELRDGYIRIRVEPLLAVARCAVLIAGHAEEREHDDEAKQPEDQGQNEPMGHWFLGD